MELEWESANLGENDTLDFTDALGSTLATSHGTYSIVIGVCKRCGDSYCTIMTPAGTVTNRHQASVGAAIMWAMMTLTDLVASYATLN